MLAYRFEAVVENGFIRIPDDYKSKIGSKIKVTVVNDDIEGTVEIRKKRPIGLAKGAEIPDSFFEPLSEEDLQLWGL